MIRCGALVPGKECSIRASNALFAERNAALAVVNAGFTTGNREACPMEIGRRIGGCSVFSKNLWLGLGRRDSVPFVSRYRSQSEKQKAPFALWRGQSFPCS